MRLSFAVSAALPVAFAAAPVQTRDLFSSKIEVGTGVVVQTENCDDYDAVMIRLSLRY